MEEKSFLGKGWGFPPTFKNQSGSVVMVKDEMDIQQSLQILLHFNQYAYKDKTKLNCH